MRIYGYMYMYIIVYGEGNPQMFRKLLRNIGTLTCQLSHSLQLRVSKSAIFIYKDVLCLFAFP